MKSTPAKTSACDPGSNGKSPPPAPSNPIAPPSTSNAPGPPWHLTPREAAALWAWLETGILPPPQR